MGVYSKIISTVRAISNIRAFISGESKDINSAWVFINGQRYLVYPTGGVVVFEQSTPGTYTFTATVPAKYEFTVVGGGGGGLGLELHPTGYTVSYTGRGGGSSGVSKFVFNLQQGDVVNLTVGAGGAKSRVVQNAGSFSVKAGNGGTSSVSVAGQTYSQLGGYGGEMTFVQGQGYTKSEGTGSAGNTTNGITTKDTSGGASVFHSPSGKGGDVVVSTGSGGVPTDVTPYDGTAGYVKIAIIK